MTFVTRETSLGKGEGMLELKAGRSFMGWGGGRRCGVGGGDRERQRRWLGSSLR